MPLYWPPASDEGVTAPSDAIFKTWAYDPAMANAGTALTGGVLYLTQLTLRQPTLISNLYTYVQTAGASLTNVGVAAFNAAGTTRLASAINTGSTTTGANATSWQAVSLKTIPVTPFTATTFYVGWWATGTTLPSMLRTAVGGSTFNAGFTLASGTGLRFAAANTGLTTTAPTTFTQTGNALAAFWAAAS